MADTGGEVNPPKKIECKERVKALREREAEERQRRLEELKKHALETQQLREQKEIERRRRMEDMRQKENERRGQVEERKKQIWEAEKDRRESILRRNQEREARIEVRRKNEKSNIVFAFGSSTPRLLEPVEGGYWLPRRATSTANLRLFPTTTTTAMTVSTIARRPSEREIDSKRRAASAGGLGDQMSSSMYAVFHWEQPRLSVPPQTDPSLSNIDQPQTHKPPNTRPKRLINGAGDTHELISRAARRKTDLMPTIPSPRDKSLYNSRPSSGTRSLARTPGRAYSMARLDILSKPRKTTTQTNLSNELKSQTTNKSMSRSTNHLLDSRVDDDDEDELHFKSDNLKQSDMSKSMVQLRQHKPMLQPRTTRAERLRNKARAKSQSNTTTGGAVEVNLSTTTSPGEMTPSRPGSALSQSSFNCASSFRLRSTPRKPRPSSIHVTGVSKDKNGATPEDKTKPKEQSTTKVNKPSTPKHPPPPPKKQINQQRNEEIKKLKLSKSMDKTTAAPAAATTTDKQNKNKEKTEKESSKIIINPEAVGDKSQAVEAVEASKDEVTEVEKKDEVAEGGGETKLTNGVVDNLIDVSLEPVVADLLVPLADEQSEPVSYVIETQPLQPAVVSEVSVTNDKELHDSNEALDDATAGGNVMSRSKITTEVEAKAALAERRKLAREQAEREAEAERRRLELEAQMEDERIRKEEEEQKRAEEEQLRLLEEARKMEQERLMQAIQEAQKREAEEREKQKQEEAAKLEKEESEKKAKEEAEKQRVEMAERLKREEEERQARRKRVEAIMKRTRNNAPNATSKGESGAEQENNESKGHLEAFLHGERLSAERSLMNGQQNNDSHKQILDNIIDTNPTNGVHSLMNNTLANEDCINSNSTIVTPIIAFQGKKKETPVTNNYLA